MKIVHVISCILFFVVVSFFIIFSSSKTVFALDDNGNIRLTGLNFPRNRFGIVTPDGQAPPYPIYGGTNLYYALRNSVNFGPEGIVDCRVIYSPFVDSISEYSLVDIDGSRKFDIFFAGISKIPYSLIESIELSRFVNNGGILYISDDLYREVGMTQRSGLGYDELLNQLGLEDRFLENEVWLPPYSYSLFPDLETSTTSGPFGLVYDLKYQSFGVLNNVDISKVVRNSSGEYSLISELGIGNGHLVVSNEALYKDVLWGDQDNRKYFLNMFAMACKDEPQEPTKILNVPSLKQNPTILGIPNISWGTDIYDSANAQSLGCGTTIGTCGCALTSATMVMKYFGIDNDSESWWVDPGRVNSVFSRKDERNSDFLTWGYSFGNFRFDRVINYVNNAHLVYPNQSKLKISVREDYSLSKVKSYIDQNIPVIVKGRNSMGDMHFVVAIGYVGDEIVINDPALADPVSGYNTISSANFVPNVKDSLITYDETFSDFSYFDIAVKNNKFQITDSMGRKAGFDSDGNEIEEIPGSNAFIDEDVGNPFDTLTGPIATSVYSTILQLPAKGEYTFYGDDELGITFSNKSGETKNLILNNEKIMYDPLSEEMIRKNIEAFYVPAASTIKGNTVGKRRWLMLAISSKQGFHPSDIDTSALKLFEEDRSYELPQKQCLPASKDWNKDKIPDLFCQYDATGVEFNPGKNQFYVEANDATNDYYSRFEISYN